RPEHTPIHPRINVIGTRRGKSSRPVVHLNGHFDVVPAGAGWTVDPFGGEVRDGRIWGRGACDMKAGIAAAIFAAEAIRRAGIDQMGIFFERVRREPEPRLAERHTEVPVAPAGARHATININGVIGGQPVDGIQTPCVADTCRAVFDRRFLLEEGFDRTKTEIVALLESIAADVPDFKYSIQDLMVVHPTRTPDDSPVIGALDRALHRVLGRSGGLVASPGTYDQKHVARIAGVPDCVAYGPGILDLAHQPDEYCDIADLVNATKVIALAVLELTGTS